MLAVDLSVTAGSTMGGDAERDFEFWALGSKGLEGGATRSWEAVLLGEVVVG